MKVTLRGEPHLMDPIEADGFFVGLPMPGHYCADSEAALDGAEYRKSQRTCPYCEAPLNELVCIKDRAPIPALRVAKVIGRTDDGQVRVISDRIPQRTHRVLSCRSCRQAFTIRKSEAA